MSFKNSTSTLTIFLASQHFTGKENKLMLSTVLCFFFSSHLEIFTAFCCKNSSQILFSWDIWSQQLYLFSIKLSATLNAFYSKMFQFRRAISACANAGKHSRSRKSFQNQLCKVAAIWKVWNWQPRCRSHRRCSTLSRFSLHAGEVANNSILHRRCACVRL